MEFSYDYFVKCILEGDEREFWYKDKIIIVSSSSKLNFIEVEYKGKIILKQKFDTPQELLDNAAIDGMMLKELWNELTLAD